MDNLELDIDFLLNSGQVQADAEKVKAEISGVGITAEQAQAKMNANIQKMFGQQVGIMEQLRQKARVYAAEMEKATTTGDISFFNSKLQQTTAELERLSNIGKAGFDTQGRAMLANEGILQRLQRAAAIYGAGMREATREENIEKYRQKLEGVNAEMARLSKGAITAGSNAKGSFNGLQNSINQISRELPAFTFSAQTGLLAISNNIPMLKDEIDKLKLANEKLVASGQKGVPVWKQLISGFFSWGTAISVGITLLTVYGKEIGDFFSSLFKGSKALEEFKEAQKRLNDVRLKGNQSAQDEITKLKTLYSITQNTTLSLTQRKEAAAELQKQYPAYLANISQENILNGNAKEAYDKLTVSILATARARAAQDLITENAKKRLENEQKIADLQREQLENTQKLKKAQQIANVSGNGTGAGIGGASSGNVFASGELLRVSNKIKENNKAQYDLNTQNIKLSQENEKLSGNINKEIENGAKLTTDRTKEIADAAAKAQKAFADTLSSREGMQDKLNALDAEYRRKSFTKDEEEKQALKQKFVDFRKIIKEENIKIATFNKSSKKKIDLIDIKQVDPIEIKATADLTYRQETENIKAELEKQKQLFADFESYRDRMGEAAANKRFGKDLDKAKTYLAALQAEYDKVKDIKAPTGVQQERITFLKAQLDKEQRLQEQQYFDLLTSLADYEQKRKNLTEKFERERAELIKKGESGAVVSLEANYKADIATLDDANIQKLDAYEKLFNGVEGLSAKATREVIADAQDMLDAAVKAGLISEELAKKIRAKLDDTNKALYNRLPNALNKAADELASMAASVSEVDKGFGSAVKKIADIVSNIAKAASGVAQIRSGLKDFLDAKKAGDPLGQLMAGLSMASGVAAAASGAYTAFVSIMDKSEEREAARQAKQQAALEKTRGFIESMNRLLELQAKIIEKSLGTDRIEAYRRQLGLITSDITTTIKKLNELEFLRKATRGYTPYDINLANLNDILKTGGGRPDRDGTTKPVVETELDTIDKVIAANRANIAALYKVIEDSTFVGNKEQLRELLNTYEQLEAQLDQYRLKLQEIVTGTTFSSIVDTIAQGFRDGLTSAQDFADSFEDMMKKAVIQSLKMQALEKPLKAFYDQLAADSESGGSLDATEIAKLKELYNSIIASAGEQFKNLQNLTGLNFKQEDGSGGGKGNTLSGVIRGITADQADLLAGQFGGQRLATLETNELLKINNQTGMEQMAQMKQNMFYLVKIEDNTRRSAQVEESYLPYLKDISNKMSSNAATRAQGG